MLTVEEIRGFIEEDAACGRKRLAKVGERYYNAEHDINGYRVFYVDSEGKVQEDKNRSNIRISHPFFTELVDQKTQYLLSDAGNAITSDKPELQKELDAYFGDQFFEELSDAVTYAAVHGWAYMYGCLDETERTRFEFADALGVIEVSEKRASDGLAYLIYQYTEITGRKGEKITHVQAWNKREVLFLIQREDENGKSKLEVDNAYQVNPRPHAVYSVEKDGENIPYGGRNYGTIPFFRLDNNKKRSSDLTPVKALIDDYDLMACGLSNNLQDVAEGIYVIKGFEGDNLSELITNIRVKKAIGVSESGNVDIKTIDIPYEARKIKLELDEKNIYRFGMGFNAAQAGDGNVTNVVIKSRYALLDLKCNKAEGKLRGVIRKILEVVLQEINERNQSGFTLEDVKVDFARTTITNEVDNATIEKTGAETLQARVSALMGTESVLGAEVVAKELCKLLDLDYEAIKDMLPDDPYDLNAASEALKKPGEAV